MNKKQIMIMALISLISMSAIGQWCQSNVAQCNPQQMFAQYQAWFYNADMQLRQQIAGMPPVMQLQRVVAATEGELSQWGGFLQQYYPVLYAHRCSQLQQARQLLAQMMNGGGMPMPGSVPFPGVSRGVSSSSRCIACRGSGMCRQCTGTGYYTGACYGNSSRRPCSACGTTGRCSICNRYEIRRLD